MAKVDLILTHWARYASRVKCLKDTLNSLKTKLKASGHEIVITVGCETYDSPYQEETKKVCSSFGARFLEQPEAPNLGRNLNNLQRNTQNPFILYVQDDFELERYLDIGPDVDLMIQELRIDMIRYTWRKIDPSEYVISEYRPNLLKLNFTCPHLYSDNPHLRRREWLDITGPYTTKDNASCENSMRASAVKHKMVVLLSPEQPFRHSGIETVMWEKWANHPKGWAASLLVTPEMANHFPKNERIPWTFHDYLVKYLREKLPRSILEIGQGMTSVLLQQYVNKVPEIFYRRMIFSGQRIVDFNAYMVTIGYSADRVNRQLLDGFTFKPLEQPFPSTQEFDLVICNQPSSSEMDERLEKHITNKTTFIFPDSRYRGAIPNHYSEVIVMDDRSNQTSSILVPLERHTPKMSRIMNSERFGKIEFAEIPQKVYELLWEIHDSQRVYRKDRSYMHDYLLDRSHRVFEQLGERGLHVGRKRVLEIGPANAIFATLMREIGHIVECVEHPDEQDYRKVLHQLAHHTHFFLIEPDNLMPPALEKGFDLINATGVQFDMYPDLSRWSTDLWINVFETWISYLKPKGEIFLARNWETKPETNLRVVRHFNDSKFLDFLSKHPKVKSYQIKEEVLTLQTK